MLKEMQCVKCARIGRGLIGELSAREVVGSVRDKR